MANNLPTTAYKRVQSPSDSLDGVACISMVVGKPIADVFKAAVEKFGLRGTHGPYYIDEARLQILFATFGYVAGNYKELTSISDLPDLALVWQDTDVEQGFGRVMLFHRMRDVANPKQPFAYVIDPAPQTNPSKQVTTELDDLELTWFMPISPMAKPK
ncbi:MAG: hypothetical protein D3M94_05635 [Rhodocyclales bacterium GT-UBC]|nr:MAG: hypothetical protein D3M94_05635 [Rhodocyclales bacterium GT-UBC]